ncbi:MAG: HDIG domain-containing protein [Synergistaceae bacterium]|nr:HDIG domain-containing protein [Synergistaceae bacterium]
MRRRVLIPSERNIFQRINFPFLYQYVVPVAFLLISGILIVLAQWAVLNQRGDSFKVGSASPETYRVISRMRYDDQESARTLRGMVSESVAGVTVRDLSAKSRLMRRLEKLRDVTDLPAAKSVPYLATFPDGLLSAFIKLDIADKSRILTSAFKVGSSLLDRLEKERVYRADLQVMNTLIWDEIRKAEVPSRDMNFVYQILACFGNLNFKTDSELTELAREAAANGVPTIDRKFEPGDVIINQGETVTEQTAILLRLQGYTEDVFPIKEIFSVITCVIMLPLWLSILRMGEGEHKPNWRCIVFIVIIAWTFETIAAKIGVYGAGTLAAVSVSFLCIEGYMAFCSAVIASTSGVFIITGQAVTNVILLSVMAVTASTIGFYIMRNLESRRQVSYRIVLMALTLTIMRMTMRYFQGVPYSLGSFWRGALLFFAFEAGSAHAMMGIIQYFEEYLGTLSIMSIREISNPSSPLLRDLQRQAPGTYQHSLTIATLIEAVGMELGMDTNLLRAGAYYHDIGKLRKPEYFVENQGGGVNIHDSMSPMLSSLAIISHVKDGLELAWEAKLPKRIRDFIAEHHGDTSTRYFYNKAISIGENVEWSQFCYPGPKPQSRETALLMITDSVEAAVRAANIRELEDDGGNSEKGKAVKTIEKIVNQVIQSKINENQFENVAFTLRDLTVIKQTLISVLQSMYHTRKVKKIERRKS